MRSIVFASLSCFSCLFFTACADGPEELDLEEVEVAPDDDGKADSASELKVRTGETSVWIDKAIVRREVTENGPAFVLRGRASRNVVDGMGFVFDDPYGDFAAKSARTFEVTFPVSVGRTLVDGVNQFVRVEFTHSNGRPDSLTTRIVARPRLASFTGSSSVYVTAELEPVVVGGLVVYRVRGRTTSANLTIDARLADFARVPVRRLDDNRFEIDLVPEQAFQILGVTAPGAELAITARLANGNTAAKTARIGVAVKKLGITAGDAYERWPRPDCDDTTKTCLLGLADGALDLGACGEAFVVQSCHGRVGVITDDVAIVAALTSGNAITAGTAFRTDAAGLVGSDRVEQLAGGAEQTIDDKVTRHIGRWYLSTTARDAQLTAAVDAGILAAYARPLDLVEPHAPVPGNANAIRQVAGDALLAELAQRDFASTAFDRSYDELVRVFRDRHVSSIRQFRETLPIEPHYAVPQHDLLVGNWLDAYVEVSVDRATGTAAGVFIEID